MLIDEMMGSRIAYYSEMLTRCKCYKLIKRQRLESILHKPFKISLKNLENIRKKNQIEIKKIIKIYL
jgi:hypothetical protein